MNTGREFNPSRLTLARKRRGLTITKLASLVGVESRSISAYENKGFAPSQESVARLSKALRFPPSFFFGDDLEQPRPDAASFRAMSKMTASQRDVALGAGAIALLLNTWIEGRFDLPQPNLPDLGRESDPESAAAYLRRQWGLGELPVKNMIHLLELQGVRVFSLAIDAVEVNAFSLWRDRTPFVFLNTRKSAENSRFDAAHELGHLVMHRHGSPQGQDAEREANAFASAFLMPQGSVIANAPRMATVDHLIALKKLWTVSVSALAYRLHTLGLLSEWHHRTLWVEIGRRGYRKQEPVPAPREASQVLEKVLRALWAEGISKTHIAEELSIPVEEIEEAVFELVGRADVAPQNALGRSRPRLMLVK
jgi:Zn-dependent peptidase ImmA (M78 family)/DNA-binding XRE family transcriptional regulator